MNFRPLLLLSLGFALPAPGVDTFRPGHSMQGEAFDEGPRQFARLLPGCATVHFPITVKEPEAQRFFDQGVTQLHGFWYFEAERSFRQAAWLEPECAMAYCGMALANINNEKRAGAFIKEAVKRQAQASPREQRWIAMWSAYFTAGKKDDKARRASLVQGMEELIADFPDDLEARAFLLLQLWEDDGKIPLASRLAVAALAQPVLAANPMHPGIHHYLIHLWNQGRTDRNALPDAARCGQSAPAIAHLWHMSGHTYSGLHRYADAAWQQEASARVDHAYMAEARILPEQIHNYAHNNEWLVRDLAFTGRVSEAVSLAKNLVELPRPDSGHQAAWRMGRERLLDLGLSFQLWDELTALEATPYLGAGTHREIERLRAMGIAWYGKGDPAHGGEELAALEKRLKELRAERVAAADRAETEAKKAGKTDEEVEKAMGGAMHGFDARVTELGNAIADVRLARALAAGDLAAAKTELPLVHDLTPLRTAEVHLALGDFAEAEKPLRAEIKRDAAPVLPYALLTEVLEKAGQPEKAAEAFAQLRERSGQLDPTTPVFARLAPVAARLGLPEDWRMPFVPASDTGERPALASLGPFRWEPYPAPGFALPDAEQQTVTLEGRKGKATLVMFYLGAGCAKCMEQLNAFAPQAKAFAEAGIDLVAVSTDTPEGLKKTLAQAKEGAFPFPVVSDHALDTFRAYRAWDDFEKEALHGTFLVDAAGKVRWQNISYQPFTEPEWLLEEAKRLLALPTVTAVVAGR